MSRRRYDYDEVYAVATQVLAVGGRPRAALAAHFGVNDATAADLLTRARRNGYDIPHGTAGRPNGSGGRRARPCMDVADGPCVCSCGQRVRNRTALGAHTWAAHDRWPTDAERVGQHQAVAA